MTEEIAQAAANLVFLGLEHGIDSIRDGGPLVPFVITELAGVHDVTRFAAGNLEHAGDLGASVERAVEHVRSLTLGPDDSAVVAYDGYLSTDADGRQDAIFVEAIDGLGHVAFVAQRYRPKGRLRGFQVLGNPALLPATDARLGGA